jgi:hypothetical protein
VIELKAEYQYSQFANLPEEVHDAIAQKLIDVTYLLYQKVMMNVEGAVLHRKTGQLADSIEIHVTTSTDPMVGWVGPVPATAKAWTLEVGGLKSYIIPIGKVGVLANRETGFFSRTAVTHPPLRARHYLQLALDDIDTAEEFLAAIDEALRL